jgi:hypothetical protein
LDQLVRTPCGVSRKRVAHNTVWSRPTQFFWALLAVGLCLGAWSLATPLGAAPDEPEHLIQATAIYRGHFDGPEAPLRYGPAFDGDIAVVVVPQWATSVADPLDWPIVPACTAVACNLASPPLTSYTMPVKAGTQFSNYPPLYYVLVGWPTVLVSGDHALYGVRFVSVVLDSALLALGLALLARYRRRALLGAMVALSPMVFFICGAVSSSGMEIAAGFAAWCAALCVIEVDPVPRRLALATAVAFVALILSRPISPANAAVVVVVAAVLAGWSRAKAVATDRALRAVWTGGGLAIVIAGAFFVFARPSLTGPPERPPLGHLGELWLALHLEPSELRETVGYFGWRQIPAPEWVYVVWVAGVAALVIYAAVVSPQARRALGVLVLAVVAWPLIFEAPKINTVGPYWEGRYWLPIVIGLPLVAATALPRMRRGPKVALLAVLFAAQMACFVNTVETYVGRQSKPGAAVMWYPPGGAHFLGSLFVVGFLGLCGQIVVPQDERARPAGREFSEPQGRSRTRTPDLAAAERALTP